MPQFHRVACDGPLCPVTVEEPPRYSPAGPVLPMAMSGTWLVAYHVNGDAPSFFCSASCLSMWAEDLEKARVATLDTGMGTGL